MTTMRIRRSTLGLLGAVAAVAAFAPAAAQADSFGIDTFTTTTSSDQAGGQPDRAQQGPDGHAPAGLPRQPAERAGLPPQPVPRELRVRSVDAGRQADPELLGQRLPVGLLAERLPR